MCVHQELLSRCDVFLTRVIPNRMLCYVLLLQWVRRARRYMLVLLLQWVRRGDNMEASFWTGHWLDSFVSFPVCVGFVVRF